MTDPTPGKTMRAAVLRGAQDLVIEERPTPSAGPDEVLVKVSSVGICGSDVHYFEHGRIGEFVVKSPMVPGHEAAGQIVAVGDGVATDRVGSRVALEPGVGCRRCGYCRGGRYNLCRDMRFFGTPPIDGALREYVVVPADHAYAVPDGMSDDAAALVEPLSVGIWAHRTARLGAGSSVLIAGAGPIGLLVTQVAAALGTTEIIVSDVEPGRLELAGSFGATTLLDATEPTGDLAVDAFIDCSGAPAALKAGVPAVKPGGAVVLVGMGADEVTLPLSLLQRREINVVGTFRYANTWPTGIALAARGLVNLDGLVTGHVDLDHVRDALRPDPSAGHVKLIVRPGG
ncbi:MAG TPA: NAD(P)-dependent alcohol dehydrogenase [Kribbella sp.]|nr:NAD(P)-dependent alcohol dehydrogenase [Kribbella sp.]